MRCSDVGCGMKKLLAILSFVVTWPASSTAAPPLPAALQPYVHNGRFDPGDYAWMRGSFANASVQDKNAFGTVRSWLKNCIEADRGQLRTELQAMGIGTPAMQQLGPPRNPLCTAVSFMPRGVASFAELQKDEKEAKPNVTSYLFAVRNTERITNTGGSLADQLKNRMLPDQMLRISWGQGDGADAPPLPPKAKAIVDVRLGAAMADVDRSNTEWLKGVVAKHGWPTISEVGKQAAGIAWLLTQHADADLPFQLKVLRVMEPLIPNREVDKQDYALLYDRVMLKITGKQHRTQLTCIGGKHVPQPLEDDAQLASRRAAMGLPQMADYLKLVQEHLGGSPNAG